MKFTKKDIFEKLNDILHESLSSMGQDYATGSITGETYEESSVNNQPDVFIDEETNQRYYIDFNEETLEEAKMIIRVNSRGQRKRLLKCGPGKVAKMVNGRKVCVIQGGRAKLTKKIALKKAVRTKKAKGAGFKRRTNIKRQRAIKKRKAMGL